MSGELIEKIPIVNFGAFIHGTKKDRITVARQVGQACERIGFFLLSGHDVPAADIRDMSTVSREYFASPVLEKECERMRSDRYRGYLPVGGQTAALTRGKNTPADLVENFSIGPFGVPDDNYHYGTQAGTYFAPNIWPARPYRMKSVWEAYYGHMEKLAGLLMQSFALALDLPALYFEEKIDRHISNFSALYYPVQRHAPKPDQLRAGEHSDLGSLTILYPDGGAGGLQIRNAKGQWLDVKPEKGQFVVNLGDLMAQWTNDLWVSTLHRVANPPRSIGEEDRLSFAFFHQPNYDAVIECVQTCCGPGNPSRYGRTTSGVHRTKQLSAGRYLDLQGRDADTM